MKRRFWLICLLFGSVLSSLHAQDQTNFTQFYLNPYLVNPSLAGIDGQSSFSIIYRRQWMNIDGGPSIANVSLHTPVNTRVNVGFSITNDNRGILDNTSALFTFGLNIPVSDNTFVRFGLSGGGAWNTIDFSRIDPDYLSDDPAFINQLDKNASLAGNAGISFHHKLFHIGASMPTIFSPAYVSPDAFTISEVKPFQSLIVHASNRFYFNNNNNVFEPYAVYRMNTDLPSQFEFAGIVHLNHVLWAGGSYKQDFGISALAGIKLQHKLAIGASYSLQNSGINELNSPTFEVSINLLFGKHKKGTHVYSFVNTVKEKEKKVRKSASQIIAEKRQKEAEDRKKQLEAQAEAKRQADAVAKAEADRKAAEALAKQPPRDTAKHHNPRMAHDGFQTFEPVRHDTAATSEEVTHEDEQATLKKLEDHAVNPTEQHNEPVEALPNAERHEFIKKGGHVEELEVGDYVVGGVFKSDANAKHFAEGLVRLGFKAEYGHLSEKNLWYVYLIHTTDINTARAERDRVRKMRLLKDAWLLTVHH